MDYDKICEGIRKLVLKEGEFAFHSTKVKLSFSPPCLDRLSTELDVSIDFDALNLSKIADEYLDDRDGSCGITEELECIRLWADEFELYAKRFRKHADQLEKRKCKN